MCLVAVYVQHPQASADAEPVLTDVARLEAKGGEVVLQELFGQPHTIQGTVRTIDFLENRVIIEARQEDEGANS
jgi:predicted RNA-binding protein